METDHTEPLTTEVGQSVDAGEESLPILGCPQNKPPKQAPLESVDNIQDVPTSNSYIYGRLLCIEQQNEAIQGQLVATQQMVQTLTELVRGLQQSRKRSIFKSIQEPSGGTHRRTKSLGPHSALVAVAKTNAEAKKPDEENVRRKSSMLRQRSVEDLDSMTRTISTKGIPIAGDEVMDKLAPLSLASAVSVVRRIAHAASRKSLRVPEMIVPMMTRRFTLSSLNFESARKESVDARRVGRWSRILFQNPRVEPIVTKREVIAARLEDSPAHPLTIRHDSSGRAAWDALVMLMVTTDVVVTPLSLSFNHYPSELSVFNILATAAFTIDFFVQAFSSYTTKRGFVISGPSNTIPRYILSVWAFADFLSWFPFEYLVSPREGRFLGVAKVIRLIKISQLMRRFHSSRKAGVFRLTRLISIVLLVSHCLACYWNWIATEWRVHEEDYLSKPLFKQYVHCWALVIGSLNASPPSMFTPVEEISVSVFMLIGNILQASVFGSVAVLIQSFDEEEVAYNKKLINTYERCKLLDIPELLADRISKYYEHLYRETRSVDPDADSFINELSPALICEVKFQLYRDMVKQIPFFSSSNIDPVIIEMLILRLRTVIYMQDDVLIRKGEFGDWMGFIGSKGSVGVLDPNTEVHKIVRILRKGEYFGEMGLLHRTKRTTTAVAMSWVQIHVLSRDDLDVVKEQYTEDAESLEHEIKKYMKSRLASQAGA